MSLLHVIGKNKYLLALFLPCLGFLINPVFVQTEYISYIPQRGSPVAIQNFVQPEDGCNWLGIGGQVFNQHGLPIRGLVVRISGTLEGLEILTYAVTGGALQFGSGGYLVKLAEAPVSSNAQLSLQILDLSGIEKSPRIYFRTYAVCTNNLVIMNLKEVFIDNFHFLPVIRR